MSSFATRPNTAWLVSQQPKSPGLPVEPTPKNWQIYLYPSGIPIFEEKDLEKLIREYKVDTAVFSYSDISHQNLMHLASRVLATGADFWLLGTEHTQVKSTLPVVSICAVRTGCARPPSLPNRSILRMARSSRTIRTTDSGDWRLVEVPRNGHFLALWQNWAKYTACN